MWHLIYASFRKHVGCTLGFHGPKTDLLGKPANVCCWGCGLVYNKDMYKDYIVTLKDGEVFEVQAINEFHAGSVVVHGYSDGKSLSARVAIDGNTGKTMNSTTKVHRENILSVELKDPVKNKISE